MIVLSLLRRLAVFLLRFLGRLIGLALLLFLLQRSGLPMNTTWDLIAYQVSEHHFNYITWEIDALLAKVDQTLFGLHPFIDEETRSQLVRDYMTELARAQSLEAQVNAIYTDPSITDPEQTSAELRVERDTLRAALRARQTLIEAILEGQVAAVLVDEGFGIAGQLFPPIAMHFTQMPSLLVTSPRDAIRLDVSINLHALPVDERAALETLIAATHDVSSLIVPLGGMALYPAMVLETTSIPWAVETFAHEWMHHYLFMFPLGLNYFTGPDAFGGQTRIINETTADLFGKEVARLVLARYYPELAPPPLPPPSSDPPPEPPPRDPDAFDFGAVMHETRVTVDALLEEGEVEAAEAYMEERRQLFVANGYLIRKLNQAYFAFYGGYQAGGIPGIAGEDPIGPAVFAVRETSPSLYDFVAHMRDVVTLDDLLELRGRLE